ncbi:hypothetical protein L1887_03832 [Cichorium endivia]|nr:hypothetical protein L1887_03832 [Cichorium endivia]
MKSSFCSAGLYWGVGLEAGNELRHPIRTPNPIDHLKRRQADGGRRRMAAGRGKRMATLSGIGIGCGTRLVEIKNVAANVKQFIGCTTACRRRAEKRQIIISTSLCSQSVSPNFAFNFGARSFPFVDLCGHVEVKYTLVNCQGQTPVVMMVVLGYNLTFKRL